MSTKNDNTKLIEEVIASEEYQAFHKEQQTPRDYLNQIQKIMDQKEITQSELSEITGITQSNLSRLFKGDRPNFSFDTFLKVCDGLGATVDIRVS